jgi:hypothetical protein
MFFGAMFAFYTLHRHDFVQKNCADIITDILGQFVKNLQTPAVQHLS